MSDNICIPDWRQAYESGDFRTARDLLLRQSPVDELDAESLAALGVCHAELDEAWASIDLFQRSIALQPGRPEPYLWLGTAFTVLGWKTACVEVLKAGLLIAPGHACIMRNLVQAYIAAGDRMAAIRMCRKRTEDSPDSAPCWMGLGAVLLLEFPHEATNAFERACAIFAARADTPSCIAEEHRLSEAADESERTSAMYRLEALAHLFLGEAYSEIDRLSEAFTSYSRAIELDPGRHCPRSERAGVASKLNMLDVAQKDRKAEVSSDPQDIAARLEQLDLDQEEVSTFRDLLNIAGTDDEDVKYYEVLETM